MEMIDRISGNYARGDGGAMESFPSNRKNGKLSVVFTTDHQKNVPAP